MSARMGGTPFLLAALLLLSVAAGARIPHIPSDDQQVDIVYTWVNGSDTKWLGIHNEWVAKIQASNPGQSLDESSKLFSDNGELRFSLRSLFEYGFKINFRKVFLVTANQVPSWLNTSDPSVEVVPHTAIFEDKTDLPTFSTFAIESNLHKIPGLGDFYIYFNDDFFLGHPIGREAFISGSGAARKQIIYMSSRMVRDAECTRPRPWRCACVFSGKLLASKFGQRNRLYGGHAPLLISRNIMKHLEETFSDAFKKTSAARFRAIGKDSISLAFFYENYLIDAGYPVEIRKSAGPMSSYKKSFKMVEVISDPAGGRGRDRSPQVLRFLLNKVKDNQFFNINKSADKNSLVGEFLSSRFTKPSPLEKKAEPKKPEEKKEKKDEEEDDEEEEEEKRPVQPQQQQQPRRRQPSPQRNKPQPSKQSKPAPSTQPKAPSKADKNVEKQILLHGVDLNPNSNSKPAGRGSTPVAAPPTSSPASGSAASSAAPASSNPGGASAQGEFRRQHRRQQHWM
eukprot:GILI01007456.1.p1 GENE.GILI01007456.1~~GILI01007456.1.p1  ORF type:complete len:554 (+),score=164.38 GILI01007456.1:134-1663(+)